MLTYQNQPYITVLDPKDPRKQETINLTLPVLRAEMDHSYFYTLTQITEGPAAGVLSVYDRYTWELIEQVALPKVRETLVQNFVVLKSK